MHIKLFQSVILLVLKDKGKEVEGKMRLHINNKPNAAGLINKAAKGTGGPCFNCMNIQTVMFGIKHS